MTKWRAGGEGVFSSLHTHTVFCDGKDDIETMCRAAFEKGLAAVGFSSHAPVGKTGLRSDWHMKDERLGEYLDEIAAARRRWQGKIAVYSGLEVDYIKGLRSPLDSDIVGLGLDYTIGSVHYLVPPCGQPFTVDGPAGELEKGIAEGYGGDTEAMINAYWDAVAEMIALGGFDIIGHLDLIKKHSRLFPGMAADMVADKVADIHLLRTEEIAAAIAPFPGLVVEVNTGGLNRGYFAETCPSPSILRLLHRHNIPVIITSDAHKAADLDGNYETARQTLLEAGYASHVFFQ